MVEELLQIYKVAAMKGTQKVKGRKTIVKIA
jgi:hypothetical protein